MQTSSVNHLYQWPAILGQFPTPTPFSSVTCRLLFHHPIIFTIMDKLKKILNTQLLEVKRPFMSVFRLVGLSVSRSVCHNIKFHFPCSNRSTCLCLSFSFFSIHIYKESFRWYPILQPHNPITPPPSASRPPPSPAYNNCPSYPLALLNFRGKFWPLNDIRHYYPNEAGLMINIRVKFDDRLIGWLPERCCDKLRCLFSSFFICSIQARRKWSDKVDSRSRL